MPKTNFFEREPRELPKTVFESPSYGKIELEQCDYAKNMAWKALSDEKLEYYKKVPFAPIGKDRVIDVTLTQAWAQTAAIVCVMQVGPDEDRYSFEELIASSVVAEEEYNMLVIAVNDLNEQVSVDPKDTNPESEALFLSKQEEA